MPILQSAGIMLVKEGIRFYYKCVTTLRKLWVCHLSTHPQKLVCAIAVKELEYFPELGVEINGSARILHVTNTSTVTLLYRTWKCSFGVLTCLNLHFRFG